MRTETVQYESGQPASGVPWPATITGAVVLGVFLLVAVLNNRMKRAFEAVGSFLQGETGGNAFFRNYFFRGAYKGRPLRLEHIPGGRSSPDWLVIALEDPLFVFGLDITEEGMVSRGLDFLGLSGDISSGDKIFDDRFRLRSEAGDLAVKYLARPAVKKGVLALFGMGADRLELLPKGGEIPGLIRLYKRRPNLGADLSMQGLLPVLEVLDRLSSPGLGAEFFGTPPGEPFPPGKNRVIDQGGRYGR